MITGPRRGSRAGCLVLADRTQAVILVQLLDNRRLQFEVLMGKRASQVTGFTNAAVIYEH